jgi:SAGA-associated factor 29
MITNLYLQPIEPSPDELSAVQELFRQNVKVCEEIKALNDSEQPYERLQILTTMKSHTEQQAAEASKARASASRDSRSTMDFDGPSDSPVPSPAENKQIRKVTASRSGSQPPKETKDEREEKESNDRSKTKVTFALGAEVAFRPKIQGSSEEHDWILGKVTKVIGEGKSRRYDVQDAEPDDPKNPSTYRSSASSMAKITPVGTPLADYEVGKKVLALYPETSTFYRAEVMGTVDNGERVQLLFAEEDIGALKYVERRFVLDHKG